MRESEHVHLKEKKKKKEINVKPAVATNVTLALSHVYRDIKSSSQRKQSSKKFKHFFLNYHRVISKIREKKNDDETLNQIRSTCN